MKAARLLGAIVEPDRSQMVAALSAAGAEDDNLEAAMAILCTALGACIAAHSTSPAMVKRGLQAVASRLPVLAVTLYHSKIHTP